MVSRRVILVLVLSLLPALIAVPGVVQPTAHSDVEAHDVMDNDSLQKFVERARAELEDKVSDSKGVFDFADMEFRPMGEWHDGPIYIFIIKTDGVILFHGATMSLEGENLWDNEDKNGVKYVQELISKAEMGGGFVEYLFDNPDVMGDEEEGSRKISYVELLSYPDEKLVIGSGFYPADEVPVAPPLAYALLALLLAAGGYIRSRRG